MIILINTKFLNFIFLSSYHISCNFAYEEVVHTGRVATTPISPSFRFIKQPPLLQSKQSKPNLLYVNIFVGFGHTDLSIIWPVYPYLYVPKNDSSQNHSNPSYCTYIFNHVITFKIWLNSMSGSKMVNFILTLHVKTKIFP